MCIFLFLFLCVLVCCCCCCCQCKSVDGEKWNETDFKQNRHWMHHILKIAAKKIKSRNREVINSMEKKNTCIESIHSRIDWTEKSHSMFGQTPSSVYVLCVKENFAWKFVWIAFHSFGHFIIDYVLSLNRHTTSAPNVREYESARVREWERNI